jgi:biopolymer transport protein TolR
MAGPLVNRQSRQNYKPLYEINVTPFVDVMLVLLIVFMVTAPLMNVGVPVDLPKTESAVLTDQIEPVVVSVNAKQEIYIQEMQVSLDELVPKLTAITENKEDTKIFVRGDEGLLYGKVMEIMGQISAAGFKKVTLVAQMPQGTTNTSPDPKKTSGKNTGQNISKTHAQPHAISK